MMENARGDEWQSLYHAIKSVEQQIMSRPPLASRSLDYSGRFLDPDGTDPKGSGRDRFAIQVAAFFGRVCICSNARGGSFLS